MGGVARKIMKPKIVTPVQPTPTVPEVSQVQATSTTGITRGKGRTTMMKTGARGLGDTDKANIKITTLGI